VAAAAFPDVLVDALSLVGPAERIRERMELWKAAARRGGVSTMILMFSHQAALRSSHSVSLDPPCEWRSVLC
jgi:hypothetical protein